MDETLVTLTRGGFDESHHRGHAAIWQADAGLVAGWGDPHAMILPRSSCKMVQALPLVESGAADRAGLASEHLALACASHQGAAIHTDRVRGWLSDLGLGEPDLRCGPQFPNDMAARETLIRADVPADQCHNNCSGKHAGFLTLSRDLGGDAEYIDVGHPVQKAALAAFEEVTGMTSPGFGIDGCSAPNHATTLAGLARAMAGFAAAEAGRSVRDDAMTRLIEAMIRHPDLVAGEGRACTRIMRAAAGRAAVKTGAEGVFVAIVPERKMGVAVKISDGASRGAEAVTAGLLAAMGVLDRQSEVYRSLAVGPIRNRAGRETGQIRLASSLQGWVP